MKSKKSLRIIAVLIGVISVFTAFGFVSAAAEGDTPAVTKEYIAVTEAKELVATEVPFDYVSVKLKEDSDPATAVAGDIDNVKLYPGETATGEEVSKGGWNKSDNTILFPNSSDIIAAKSGKYTVVTTMKDADKNGKKEFTTVVTVYTVGSDLSYAADAGKIAGVQEKINGLTVSEGKSLTLPFDDISALVNSEIVDKKELTYKMYYRAPGSASFSAATTKKGDLPTLSVSAKGTYSFYVLADDGNEFGVKKEISIKDCEENRVGGVYGWYKKDTTTLVAPIFTYENKENKEITVTVKGDSGTGRVKQRYQNLSVTVENASDTLVKLQYNATSGEANAEGWVDATAGKEARFSKDGFKSGTYYFTPLKKGYFRLSVKAKGGEDGVTVKEVKTDAVSVHDQVEELKLEDERLKNFFKNNWLSLIFLGIAVLCLVGIVVVALWKPADNNGKKSNAKVKKVVAEAEVKDVSDESSEAVEADEPVEEAKEETTEETVEPVEAVEAAEAGDNAEETPSEDKGE